MGTLQSSIDFDNEVYLTETMPGVFAEAQAAAPKVTAASGPLFTRLESKTKRALLTWLSQSPSMKVWEGERHIKKNSSNEFTVSSVDYELTLGIDARDMDDAAEVDSFAQEVASAGDAAGQHQDEVMWDFVQNQGTVALAYDGQPLFDAAHTRKDGSTYSNYTAAGGTPGWYLLDTKARAKGVIWQVRQDYTVDVRMASQSDTGFMTGRHLFGIESRMNVAPGDPARIYRSHATLDETNFEAAWETMTSYVGDSGRPIVVQPTVLMVPPAMEFDARKLMATLLVGGGNTNHLANMAEVVVNPYLI